MFMLHVMKFSQSILNTSSAFVNTLYIVVIICGWCTVDKFFAGLQPGGERVRYNMTFCERPSLHLPEHPCAIDCPMPGNGLPHEIYMRVERQALISLPESGAVLFTIRTYRQNVMDIPREHHAALLRGAIQLAKKKFQIKNSNNFLH